MKNRLQKLRAFYGKHPKRFWVIGIILVLIIIGTVTGGPKDNVTVITAERTDLKETVLATGQVTSTTDLNLSFKTTDIVQRVNVEVGDFVYRGQILASLDNRDEFAALKSAQARYNKVIEGATSEEVAVAEAALAAAESDLRTSRNVQNTLVANAYRDLLNTNLTPKLVTGTTTTAPTVTGKYDGDTEGLYTMTVNLTSGEGFVSFTGIETGTAEISTTSPQPLGTKGLFVQFPSNYASFPGNTWRVSLPNTASASYNTDYNAYQSALQTRENTIAQKEAAVVQRQADLNLKKAAARTSDVEAAEADVLTAQVAYENTILRAPLSGTIVRVDTKIGELVQAQNSVMTLQDVGNIYVEANINESNIAKLALGVPVTMTLDAFGPLVEFPGEVIHIDPSATTDDGVVNYEIHVSLEAGEKEDAVRPGMNANLTMITREINDVIVIPQAAIETENGVSTVLIPTKGTKKRGVEKREVTLGARGDGNLVEITEGLAEGETIIYGA